MARRFAMIIKSKKAFLLGEYTLKIIIAVFALLLLFYLLFSLYSFQKEAKSLADAEETISSIVERLDGAKKETQKIVLLKPADWVFLYYPTAERYKPALCRGDCFCICEQKGWTDWTGDQMTLCQDSGFCKTVPGSFNQFGQIILPADIEVSFNQNKFVLTKI
jgi:hypothetical protein